MTQQQPADSHITKRPEERLDAVGFFDISAEGYARKHYGGAVRSFMSVRQTRVLEFVDDLALPRGADVLDAGCGPGYLVEALASREFRLHAMDAAAEMLRLAQERLERSNPAFPGSFRQGSIEALPYEDESFDLVCSTGVIEYLPDDRQVLAEMFRVLRPGGHLVLPITNYWSPANWLEFIIEPLKRQDWVREFVNARRRKRGLEAIRPRHFKVRRHKPAEFRRSLQVAGFQLRDDLYFHFLPWPRPVDSLVPGITAALGSRMEGLARTRIGPVGEGYLTISKKP